MPTFTARRLRGDQFTSDDLIETTFDYSDLGKMEQCVTKIELVSGVVVTHGGGAPADDNLHYKDVSVDADSDGYIDYTTQNVQVEQTAKGDSVIKIVINYLTLADHLKWKNDYKVWSDAYQTIEVLASGEQIEETANGAPTAPAWSFTTLKTGNIELGYTDDTPV